MGEGRGEGERNESPHLYPPPKWERKNWSFPHLEEG